MTGLLDSESFATQSNRRALTTLAEFICELRLAFSLVNLCDLGDWHPGVEHLLNAPRPLGVGERLALIVGRDLLRNPLTPGPSRRRQ